MTIDTEVEDINVLNFLLLIEIAISDSTSPVLSRAVKNILKRFPSWMSMTEDSVDQATPNLFEPKSTAGKFLNAVVGETLDNFDREIDIYRINSFIDRADENQLDWIYLSTNVKNTFNKIIGNNVELARVDNLVDFYRSRPTDYIFYHNPLNREILTLKKFQSIYVKSEYSSNETLDQTPIQKFNWFDEFGFRVGLGRLYLESNISFKARILDVFKNPIGSNVDAFKKTLRRELNLWKAFGETPPYENPGATPEVLEMSDIENSLSYFDINGNPTTSFKNFVKDLNIRYPTNWGYFTFDDSIWDYAGSEAGGINRLRSRYYDDDIQIPYYQPGVGDLSDAKISIVNFDATPKYFNTEIVASGKKKIGTAIKYDPVKVAYEYYASYEKTAWENQAATVNLTLEFSATPHGIYTSPTIFVAPFIINPKNNFSPGHPASPEYFSREIFDTEGFVSTIYPVIGQDTIPYSNTINGITSSRLDIKNILNITIKNGLWNGSTYATPNLNDDFIAKFSHRNDSIEYLGSGLSATPNFSQSTFLQVQSKLYDPIQRIGYTPVHSLESMLNDVATPPSTFELDHDTMMQNIIMPEGATPKYIYVNNIKPTQGLSGDSVSENNQYTGFGGYAHYLEADEDIFVPSSPNITLRYYGSDLSTPTSTAQIGSTSIVDGAATANYYFTNVEYLYGSTPNKLELETVDAGAYPFTTIEWEPFTLPASPSISGYINEDGVVRYNPIYGEYIPGKNDDSILVPELTRESFGLSGVDKFEYFFESMRVIDPAELDVSIWSEQKIINPFLNRSYVLEKDNIDSIINNDIYTTKKINYPRNSVIESYDLSRNTTTFTNFIVKGKLYDSKLEVRINTGWINLDNNDYYIYAKPQRSVFSGMLKQVELPSVPRQGAPVSLNVYNDSTPVHFVETAFPDEATPREFGFYNTEDIKPRYNSIDNSYLFNLGYKNIYDISVVDGLTGEVIITDFESPDSYFTATPNSPYTISRDRNYKVRYRVKNSYFLDNVLNDLDYYSRIVFDATPNSDLDYEIVYESSIDGSSTPVSLDFGDTTSFLDEGYIIVSSKLYVFNTAAVTLSPSYVMDDKQDYMTISIYSSDIEKNPKPNQSFRLSNPDLIFDKEILTTDDEGFASTNARFAGLSAVSMQLSSSLLVTGISYPQDLEAHIDSDSSNFLTEKNFEIYSNKSFSSDLSALSNPISINADGISSVIVSGIITTSNIPQSNKVIYWRKDREIYPILQSSLYSIDTTAPTSQTTAGIVYSDENGRFQIGPIQSQDRATPGYWFMVVESELESTARDSATPMIGDIVYWNETYDNIDINYVDGLRIPDIINFDPDKSLDLYATPSFSISYYNEDLVDLTGSTPRWKPPVWLPVSRYEQYQAGYLGSTPYQIGNYSGLIKDYED